MTRQDAFVAGLFVGAAALTFGMLWRLGYLDPVRARDFYRFHERELRKRGLKVADR